MLCWNIFLSVVNSEIAIWHTQVSGMCIAILRVVCVLIYGKNVNTLFIFCIFSLGNKLIRVGLGAF